MKKIIHTNFLLFVCFIALSACTTQSLDPQKLITRSGTSNKLVKTTISSSPTPTTEMYLGQRTDPTIKKSALCDKIDEKELIIKVNFAEGVKKDTSYETGFYLSPILSTMRLARHDCDYRTSFSYEEMKGKGAVQVGVRGYSDNRRRRLKEDPLTIIFDEHGKPNIAFPIEVTVLD